ncbi:SH3 domain-containing protein C23A1.17 isoform X1 [Ziziphus jujuba]|uniref:SH3 domain-containing protein C23A1.17 isoform X1 n=1 Tax=Ziziphus jujuba TaxID=326968 RepID=A0ABM3IG91_ZIZJJ|nr:SH3 domain-containing protein C23A1.17 isoform X1 [Ziziphus jujuba]
MSAKVEPPTTALNMSGTTISSKPSTASSGQKVSMFAAKSGFVIPKNKLSGSLVPIFRGAKKLGGSDSFIGESNKQVQRKTKWGPDLTQDTAVRRGRAFAYQQTRVDQITQQLKSSVSEAEDDTNSTYAAQTPDEESSRHQIVSEKVEQLELEKREIIGEILKLNPSYKPPPDYKPILKETRVPIPVKEYPEYNFVGLLYGPGNDNQKRLEKETGAKIQLYGTKPETGEKLEIKSSDGNKVHGAYEELYVHISAETFEKIDAAVSVIELLITSISGNLAAASTASNLASRDNLSVSSQVQVSTTSDLVPSAVVQPVAGPTQMPPQGQVQYTGPWFPSGPPSTAVHLPGSIPPNSSTPVVNNTADLSTSPFKPLNMPSLFGPPPVPVAGFNSILQAPTPVLPRAHPSTQVPQHEYMAQTSSAPIGPQGNPSAMASQPFSAQPKVSTPFSSTGNQMPPMGSPGINRPVMPLLSQPASAATGSSTLWSTGRPVITPASADFNNTGQMAPTMVPPHRPQPLFPQPGVSSTLLSTTITASTFPPRPSTQLSNTPLNHPTLASGFASVPRPHMGLPPTISASVSPAPVPAPAVNSFARPTLGSASVPSIGPSVSLSQPMQSGIPTSVSKSVPNFAPVKPPLVTAPSSGDFTFQSDRPHNPTSQTVARLNSHSANQNALPTSPMLQAPALQAPSSRLPAPNFTAQPVNQMFLRQQVADDHMGQPQSHINAVSFGRNPTAMLVPPRLPTFPDTSPAARNQNLLMRPRNFIPPPQMANLPGPFLPRPGNLVQQNYPVHTNWSVNNPSFTSGKSASSPEQQLYDPFSPTSMFVASEQQGGNATKIRKQENKSSTGI